MLLQSTVPLEPGSRQMADRVQGERLHDLKTTASIKSFRF